MAGHDLDQPDQVADLLRQRQSEHSRRTSSKSTTKAAQEQAAQLSAHRALAAQRKELNSLVSAYARKTGSPHGVVHSDLRRRCGGPALDQASADEVGTRIETIRRWFVGRT